MDHNSAPKRGFVLDDRTSSPDGRSAKRYQRHQDQDCEHDAGRNPYFRAREDGSILREREDRDVFKERDESGGWPRDGGGSFRLDDRGDGRRDTGAYGRFRERDSLGHRDEYPTSERSRQERHESLLPQPFLPPAPDSPPSIAGDVSLPKPPLLVPGDFNGRPRRSFHDGPQPSLSGMSGASSGDSVPAADVSALLQRGRLCLVLDLDNVLLNISQFTETDPDTEQLLQARLAAEATAKLHDSWLPELFRMDQLGVWVKLRPGAREFLRRCMDRYELWVYTSGSRSFADAVVDLIDPHRQLFNGRIICRGHVELDSLSKRLMSGLEVRTAVSLILGDSSVSWMADRRNLFVVEQYLFFPSSRRRHGVVKGKSLLDINRCEISWLSMQYLNGNNVSNIFLHRDECPERGMLMTAFNVLDRISTVFSMLLKQPQLAPQQPVDPNLPPWCVSTINLYNDCKIYEFTSIYPDVSMSKLYFSQGCTLYIGRGAPQGKIIVIYIIFVYMQKQIAMMCYTQLLKVLKGVSIVFSHVIPLGQDPKMHPLWCLAEQFGAQCFMQCSESCTHVIANVRGTEKTCWASQQSKPVVTTSWCGNYFS